MEGPHSLYVPPWILFSINSLGQDPLKFSSTLIVLPTNRNDHKRTEDMVDGGIRPCFFFIPTLPTTNPLAEREDRHTMFIPNKKLARFSEHSKENMARMSPQQTLVCKEKSSNVIWQGKKGQKREQMVCGVLDSGGGVRKLDVYLHFFHLFLPEGLMHFPALNRD